MLPDDLTDELAALHGQADNASRAVPPIRVEYRTLDPLAPPPPEALAIIHFGASPRAAAPEQQAGPLAIEVALPPLQHSPAPAEIWLATGPVRQGCEGMVRHASDGHHLFGLIEADERELGGIRAAGEAVYAAIRQFQARSSYPHVLRMWNYLDAINEGSGDLERYREFCVGRARGIGPAMAPYPAATAIGHPVPTHRLQVFWLAGRDAGQSIENPRQVSAFRYPRTYGPASPGFSRATLAADGTLLISGTASIVGHLSRHPGDAARQLEETLLNLAELRRQADRRRDATAGKILLKAYLRDPALLEPVAARLAEFHPGTQPLFLAGEICRRELLLEIESIQPG